MNRAALARQLAPVAPPCFQSRDIWLSYLASAAEEQRGSADAARVRPDRPNPVADYHPGPLLFRKGEPVAFNYEFAFCADCLAQHSFHMHRAGKCIPTFLVDLQQEALSAA